MINERSDQITPICNLFSIAPNRAAIIAPFRVMIGMLAIRHRCPASFRTFRRPKEDKGVMG
jgi:hypothetical protein